MMGRFDKLHGDEDECRGRCGVCDECMEKFFTKGDMDYESYREEDLCITVEDV